MDEGGEKEVVWLFERLTMNGKKGNDFIPAFGRPELVERQCLSFAKG